MKKEARILVMLGPALGLAGCDFKPEEKETESGVGLVNKGILHNAIANIYRGDERSEVIKRVFTKRDGTFDIEGLTIDGVLYVEVQTSSQTIATCDSAVGCGPFKDGLKQSGEFDKNLNGIVDFGDKYLFNDPAFVLTGLIVPENSPEGNSSFAVTPLTHLAAQEAIQRGPLSPEDVRRANLQIAELFGLAGQDITFVIPPDITDPQSLGADGISATAQQYATINAAIASLAEKSGQAVSNLINDLTTNFVENNGIVGNSSDPNTTSLAVIFSEALETAQVAQQETDVDLNDAVDQVSNKRDQAESLPPDEFVELNENPIDTPDFDGDGISDEDELGFGTDPLDPDSDDDGLLDGKELEAGTDPLDPDSDNDGMSDGFEVDFNLNPNDGSDANDDPDGDGLSNFDEFNFGSNPLLSDTDGDGLNDLLEGEIGASPVLPDTDFDQVNDLEEYTNGTDPNNPDTDFDRLSDFIEITDGNGETDPTVVNPIVIARSDANVIASTWASSGAVAVVAGGQSILADMTDSVAVSNGYALAAVDSNSVFDRYKINIDSNSGNLITVDTVGTTGPFARGVSNSNAGGMLESGRLTSFESYWDFNANMTTGFAQSYLYDSDQASFTKVGGTVVNSSGTSSAAVANIDATSVSVSSDGQRVAFITSNQQALLISTGSSTGPAQAFVWDRPSNEIKLASVQTRCSFGSCSVPFATAPFEAKISGDGNAVLLEVSGSFDGFPDRNGGSDLYVSYMGQQKTIRINKINPDSANYTTAPVYGGYSTRAQINHFGDIIAFESNERGIVNNGGTTSYPSQQILVYDGLKDSENPLHPSSQSGDLIIVASSNGSGVDNVGNNGSYNPKISADGFFVAFESMASNFKPLDTNGGFDVFHAFSLQQNQLEFVSRVNRSLGDTADDYPTSTYQSYLYDISPDGSKVYFKSEANLDSVGDGNGAGSYSFYHAELFINAPDNDGDGVNDPTEFALGTDPNQFNDLNNDGVQDPGEIFDQDGDGMPDDWEYYYHLQLTVDDSNQDPDGDGKTNIDEFNDRSNPRVDEGF